MGYKWTEVTSEALFAPRDGAGALVFDDRMWLLGGWNPRDMANFPRTCNNEVWSSSDGRGWMLEKQNTFHNTGKTFNRYSDWAGRHTAGYAVFKDRMWIVGGDANQGHYHNDVWNSSDGKTWEYVNKHKPVPWGPRALHHTVVFDGRIWIMGGQTMPQFAEAEEKYFNDVWTTRDGLEWEKIIPAEPFWTPRGAVGGSAVLNGRMWMIGGARYPVDSRSPPVRYNDVWSSPDGIKWECHTESAPWKPRIYHDVAVFDEKLWLLEGAVEGAGNTNEVWFSSDGENWEELRGAPWKPRHAASVFVFKNALWMVAGNNMESDVWKLEIIP